MLVNELFNSNSEPVIEGVLDNPGQEDSPVASAIIRRILLQRTDLLSKYGPERVGAAVDDVADSVGDWDEIGSSDVSGWVRRVEQMLGNMTEGSLEEISRRDLLKGAGAAAVVGAAGGVKAQEVKFDVAARIAVQKAQAAIGKFFWIRLGGEQSRIMDYIAQNVNKAVLAYSMDTNGYNVLEVIDYATDSAYRAADAVPPSITDRGGAKTAISTANTFMDAYTAAILQKLNEYTRAVRSQQQSQPQQQQAQSQRSGAKDIFTPEYANLNLALSLYIVSKDSNPEIHTQVKNTLNQYIQNNNNKEFVNDAYRAIANAVESSRKRDPEVQTRREDSFIKAHRSIIDNLNKSAQKDEFKEGDISQLEKDVADAPVEPIANMEAQEKIGGRYDADDFDDMVSRLKKLAGSGPMKTVWDPDRRVYRNMPTAVQPPQQPKK
jgi:hypothetical protein